MSYFRTLFFICLLAFNCINAQAVTIEQTTINTTTTPATTPNITSPAPASSQLQGKPMIVTPIPAAKEVIATPAGYVGCFNVDATWYKGAWIPQHRICQYESAPGKTVTYEGVAWVDSYWACTQYTGTACTKWEWKPGHWVKTLEVY